MSKSPYQHRSCRRKFCALSGDQTINQFSSIDWSFLAQFPQLQETLFMKKCQIRNDGFRNLSFEKGRNRRKNDFFVLFFEIATWQNCAQMFLVKYWRSFIVRVAEELIYRLFLPENIQRSQPFKYQLAREPKKIKAF